MRRSLLQVLELTRELTASTSTLPPELETAHGDHERADERKSEADEKCAEDHEPSLEAR